MLELHRVYKRLLACNHEISFMFMTNVGSPLASGGPLDDLLQALGALHLWRLGLQPNKKNVTVNI